MSQTVTSVIGGAAITEGRTVASTNPARLNEAQRLADEAHSLAARHGLSALVGQIDRLRQAIRNGSR